MSQGVNIALMNDWIHEDRSHYFLNILTVLDAIKV